MLKVHVSRARSRDSIPAEHSATRHVKTEGPWTKSPTATAHRLSTSEGTRQFALLVLPQIPRRFSPFCGSQFRTAQTLPSWQWRLS
jgi:hypothetical protein